MKQEEQILFQLIRSAIGLTPIPSPTREGCVVDWRKVLDIAFEQGVAAIAAEGLTSPSPTERGGDGTKTKYERSGQGGAFGNLFSPEMEDLRDEWTDCVLSAEAEYEKHWSVACEVADWLQRNGIATFVLKGHAYAQLYPEPRHRSCCDVDILPVMAAPIAREPEDGEKAAWVQSNKLLEALGARVNAREKKHSHVDFRGVHIENHQFVTGTKGTKRGKNFDRYLKGLLAADTCPLKDKDGEDSLLLSPGPLFNKLFYLKHAQTHFLVEDGIQLKHILDWALLRRKQTSPQRGGSEDESEEAALQEAVERFGLRKFYAAVDEVTEYVMGERNDLSDPGRTMLNDILTKKRPMRSHGSRFVAHVNILRTIWRRRKLYKYFSDISAIRQIWIYLYGYVVE